MRRLHCWLVVVLVALLGAGCTPAAQGEPSPLATQSEPPLLTPSREQSPLATWDPSASDTLPDSTVGEGTLDISSNCVLLLLPNQKRVLLVWPEPTSWNATSQTIQFVDPHQGHERVELRAGDRIRPGGVSAMGSPSYVIPPDPSCQADETFIVNSVTMMAEE